MYSLKGSVFTYSRSQNKIVLAFRFLLFGVLCRSVPFLVPATRQKCYGSETRLFLSTSTNEKHLKLHNPRHCWLWRFNSWLSLRRSETALPLIISAVFFLWILVKPSIHTDQQIFSTRAKHLSTAIVRDLYLTHTHLGSRPFHQLPRPSLLQNLIYHACPLLDNMSTFHAQSCCGYREKRWTDGHMHTHTDRPTAITLAAHACRQGVMNNKAVFKLLASCEWPVLAHAHAHICRYQTERNGMATTNANKQCSRRDSTK